MARVSRRLASVVVVMTLGAGLVAGCGGDDDSTTTASTPPPKAQSEQEIRAVLDDFYSDDNQAKCQTLSAEALKTMGGMDACLNNDAPATKTPFDVKQVKISGTNATVHLKAGESVGNVHLVFEDGAWKWSAPVPLSVQL
jgi:hypothetical protein